MFEIIDQFAYFYYNSVDFGLASLPVSPHVRVFAILGERTYNTSSGEQHFNVVADIPIKSEIKPATIAPNIPPISKIYDGYGVRNIFQSQKQYQQIKAMKAQENVLKYRMDKSQADEKALLKKVGFFARNHLYKAKNGFDRVVEAYVQEATPKGDFNNLRNARKPLFNAQIQNPYLDFTSRKLNKILLDNDFSQWITLQQDIKQERIYFCEYPLTDKQVKPSILKKEEVKQ
uniref:DnaJ homologue subfamily C member 28 conserved domain-containing protein n=1 Tax=Glossina palpalis gambiensis TaxID=67801 RepID=A0A1B0C202_9MUSC